MKKLVLSFAVAGALMPAFPAAAGVTVPATFGFADEAAMASWRVIDANADGFTWKYDSSDALYPQNKNLSANDWLIAPSVTLEAGKTYMVSVFLRNATTYSADKQDFEIRAGMGSFDDADVATALPTVVLDKTGVLKGTTYQQYDGYFAPTTTGDWTVAVYLKSVKYMGDCRVQKIVIKQFVARPGAVTGLTAVAQPQGAMAASLTWNWPTDGDIAGTKCTEITGADIYRGSTSTFTVNTSSKVGTLTLDAPAAPGSAAEYVDATMTSPGKFYYKVVPFNDEGISTKSPISVQTNWVGHDSPRPVTAAVATINPDNNKQVSITFTPGEAANGGYIDASKITYRIRRTNQANQTVTVEEAWAGTLPYVDNTIPEFGSYTYDITTYYNGTTGYASGTKTNSVICGGTVALPYVNALTSTAAGQLLTMFNTAGSKNWSVSSSGLDYWNSTGTTYDAYTVLPPMELQAGKTYSMEFKTYVSKTAKNLAVHLGSAATAEALQQTTLMDESISATSTTPHTAYLKFTVPSNGVYYLALRTKGTAQDANDIYVKSVIVDEVISTPLGVTDAAANAAPAGQLAAVLTWTNPSVTTTDAPLQSVSVDIKRAGQIIATLDNQAAGSQGSYTDTSVPEAGKHVYTLTTRVAETVGEAVEVTSAWIGHDTPAAPANVQVAVTPEGRVVSYGAVTAGINGGYVDAAAVTYEIARNTDILAQDVADLSYTDAQQNLPLGKYTYSVTAVSGALRSQTTQAAPIMFGDALELPYVPNLANAADGELWTLVNTAGTARTWAHKTAKSAIETPGTCDGEAWAFTPPLHIIHSTGTVSFRATCYSYRYPEDMEVYLCTDKNPGTDGKTLLGSYHITSANYPSVTSAPWTIEQPGKYYVAFRLAKPNWGCTLTEPKVEFAANSTGVSSVTANTGAISYNRALETLTGNGFITVTAVDGTRVAAAQDAVSVAHLAHGLYIATLLDNNGKTAILKFAK